MASFHPSVIVDGQRVEAEGWMFVLAFAMRGVPWAVKDAFDPKLDIRGQCIDYIKRQERAEVVRRIEELDRQLAALKRQLEI